MSEKVFFQDSGVTVTNARFVTPGQTHALAGITSVRHYIDKPSRMWPIILIIIGLLMFTSKDVASWAIVPIIIGGIWLFLQKATHSVLISTAAGEANALSGKDGQRITKIVDALNNAIIHRG